MASSGIVFISLSSFWMLYSLTLCCFHATWHGLRWCNCMDNSAFLSALCDIILWCSTYAIVAVQRSLCFLAFANRCHWSQHGLCAARDRPCWEREGTTYSLTCAGPSYLFSSCFLLASDWWQLLWVDIYLILFVFFVGFWAVDILCQFAAALWSNRANSPYCEPWSCGWEFQLPCFYGCVFLGWCLFFICSSLFVTVTSELKHIFGLLMIKV